MGQVQFEVQAPAGTVLDFSYTEDPLAPPRGPFDGMHSGTRYVARGANDHFKLYDALGFRYAYVLVHGVAGPVTLRSFAVQEDIYPWQPGAEFACSDDALNRIFTAGIRTVQLNARDAFTDCPTREQQAWVGDSVVHQMVSLVTNTDWRLAWQYLNLSNSPALRRHPADDRGRAQRGGRRHHHPRLVAALGARRLQPLPFPGRQRCRQGLHALDRARPALVRAVPDLARACSRT